MRCKSKLTAGAITVPDDCAASPIIALPTSAMTSLSFLCYFGQFPKDKPVLRWLHENQADEWPAALRKLLKKAQLDTN